MPGGNQQSFAQKVICPAKPAPSCQKKLQRPGRLFRAVPGAGTYSWRCCLLLGLTDATSNAGGFSVDGGAGGVCGFAASSATAAVASRSFLDMSVH